MQQLLFFRFGEEGATVDVETGVIEVHLNCRLALSSFSETSLIPRGKSTSSLPCCLALFQIYASFFSCLRKKKLHRSSQVNSLDHALALATDWFNKVMQYDEKVWTGIKEWLQSWYTFAESDLVGVDFRLQLHAPVLLQVSVVTV